jgi:DNA-binding transcriptional MocR family regulator
MPDNILLGHGLSAYAKVVWAGLRRHADENGRCFPSVPTLSRELEMSVRQVQYATRELEALHFLVVTRRKIGAHNYTNSYQLQGFEQRAREQVREPVVSNEDCVTVKGGASRAPGGASRAPRTISLELYLQKKEREKEREAKPSFFLENQPGQSQNQEQDRIRPKAIRQHVSVDELYQRQQYRLLHPDRIL